MRLGELKKGVRAQIVQVGGHGEDPALIARLLEMGFLEGAEVEVCHEAPFSHDPIAIRVRSSLLAVRRNEANGIEVRILSDEKGSVK